MRIIRRRCIEDMAEWYFCFGIGWQNFRAHIPLAAAKGVPE